jgi:hypothetical protein
MISDKSRDTTSVHSPTLAQNANTTAASHVTSVPSPESAPSPMEAVDLQVDYWMIPPKMEAMEKLDRSAKKEVKCSLKTMFRSMQVFRPQSASILLPQQPLLQQQQQPVPQQHTSSSLSSSSSPDSTSSSPGLSMIVVTREKKQKIMRIGKKSKELDAAKSQQIDGISRLICTSKSQSHPLSVTIDGVDWSGVKFFQVSSQWQTHVKHFPVLIFAASEIPTI